MHLDDLKKRMNSPHRLCTVLSFNPELVTDQDGAGAGLPGGQDGGRGAGSLPGINVLVLSHLCQLFSPKQVFARITGSVYSVLYTFLPTLLAVLRGCVREYVGPTLGKDSTCESCFGYLPEL